MSKILVLAAAFSALVQGPPFVGQADVDYTSPVTKRVKDTMVTTLMVKNNTNGTLVRLTVDETWYDAAGALVAGGKGYVNSLEPGAVATVKIETPFNKKMSSKNYNFSHANGTVTLHKVPKLVPVAKTPARKK